MLSDERIDDEPKIPDHEEIYLTRGIYDDDVEICWCEDQIGDKDVKYIRADIVEKLIGALQDENAALRIEMQRHMQIAADMLADDGALIDAK